jgi:hypothetical protein
MLVNDIRASLKHFEKRPAAPSDEHRVSFHH